MKHFYYIFVIGLLFIACSATNIQPRYYKYTGTDPQHIIDSISLKDGLFIPSYDKWISSSYYATYKSRPAIAKNYIYNVRKQNKMYIMNVVVIDNVDIKTLKYRIE